MGVQEPTFAARLLQAWKGQNAVRETLELQQEEVVFTPPALFLPAPSFATAEKETALNVPEAVKVRRKDILRRPHRAGEVRVIRECEQLEYAHENIVDVEYPEGSQEDVQRSWGG